MTAAMLWSAAKPLVKLILLIAVGAGAQYRIPNFSEARKGIAVLVKNVFVSTTYTRRVRTPNAFYLSRYF